MLERRDAKIAFVGDLRDVSVIFGLRLLEEAHFSNTYAMRISSITPNESVVDIAVFLLPHLNDFVMSTTDSFAFFEKIRMFAEIAPPRNIT